MSFDFCTHLLLSGGLGLWCLMPLSTIFQLYRGGNRRKPPTCRKSLTNYHIKLYRVHLNPTTYGHDHKRPLYAVEDNLT